MIAHNQANEDYLTENGCISIRRMRDADGDYRLLAKWLSDPNVLEFYGGKSDPYDLERVLQKYTPRTKGESSVVPCIIERSREPIGYLQCYPIDADEYGTGDAIDMAQYAAPYGLDLFIGETNCRGKGLGTKAVRAILSFLFTQMNTDVVFIDPQTWNARAIRCYEKCGFAPVAVIPKRELHDGKYRDSLILSIRRDVWNINP